MNFPTRQINNFELSDRLRQLERPGAEVPMLQNSNYTPTYVETRKDGAEVYRHGGRTVEVRAGEVIDSHGNVVNLQRLQAQTLVIHTDRSDSPIMDKYRDLRIPSADEPRDGLADKYADFLR